MASNSKNLQNKNSIRNSGATYLFHIIALGVLSFTFLSAQASDAPVSSEVYAEPIVLNEPVSIVLTGDLMLDRGVRGMINKYSGGDYAQLFLNTPYLKEADISFTNLEGPIGTTSKRTGSKYSFLMDPSVTPVLKEAGFDIVSFSNNHVGDYSLKAFTVTMERLTENGILYAGAGLNKSEASSVKIIEVRGVKVGFLAASDVGPSWMSATDNRPGIILANELATAQMLAVAKAQVDVLVVSFHWGNEYSPASVRQEKIAHDAIDAGADIVVGHHPHVMQKIEEYNGKLIFYSLGNFIFDQYFSPHTMQGMVAKISIDPDTLAISHEAFVSKLDKHYIPQELVPFDESMLLTKSFTP